MKVPSIAIFDIGKTNKKLLLFDNSLRLISEYEERFPLIKDEDGFECDNIELIEYWIKSSLLDIINSNEYDLKGVNFATYGATVVYLDGQGKKLTPVYNYLKPVDPSIPDGLYKKYGGKEEFCRRTASPALGMLNSGIQVLWLKKTRPDIFSKVKHILHLPQYLSYSLTGKFYSEPTSIGCHTALWDFDNMKYHPWIGDEHLNLPLPAAVNTCNEITLGGNKISVGVGIHDSSSSLAPYFKEEKFLLVSTGTWCITMNPFNSEKLTDEELANDCLCYLSINNMPVKSSRLFLGHLHEEGIKIISEYFKINENGTRLIKPDLKLLNKLLAKFIDEKVFIIPDDPRRELRDEPDMFVFDNFIEAYHQLMVELADLTIEAIHRVIPESDEANKIYITGGFARNALFLKLIASSFPDKSVYTSEISNATALGAALVIHNVIFPDMKVDPELGLVEVRL
jgi:sugar (pentulose or hexulose) kinase